MGSVKKLLFITSNRLGDAVLSTGVLAAALERFAPQEVTVACGPIPAPLFAGVPGLKKVFVLDKAEGGLHWLKCWLMAAPQMWDVVIDIRNSVVSYTVPSRTVFRFTGGPSTQHKAAQLAHMLGLKHIPWNRIWLTPQAEAAADALLPAGQPFLALCPTANWPPKVWPAARFVEAAIQLGFSRVAIFGAAHEAAQADEVRLGLEATHSVINLVGKTDPLVAAACLARAALCLANDSGLMHIAAAMGTPTLGIFGPSNDAEYAPHGPRAAFLRGEPFKGLVHTPNPEMLMHQVYPPQVVARARELLQTE